MDLIEGCMTVPLADLVRTLKGSCDTGDKDWLAAVMYKVCDSQMPYLVDSLMDNGQTTPINVVVGWPGGPHMGNGHHRLLAMLALGFRTVDIVVTESLDFASSEPDDNGVYDDMLWDEDFPDPSEDAHSIVSGMTDIYLARGGAYLADHLLDMACAGV